MTVGTQAAVLAGLDMTMFVEFNPPPNSEWVGTVSGRCCVHSKVWCLIHLTTRIYAYLILLSRLLFAMQDPEMVGRCLKFLYYITITCAFCANLLVVANTTILSVLGAGMALRGPDGSMMTATDGLYEERKSVFNVFGIGLACTLCSVVLCVWIILHWEAALACMCITLVTIRKVYENYQRVTKRFDFDENDTVDFRDIFEGAGNVQVYRKEDMYRQNKHNQHKRGIPNRKSNRQKNQHSSSNHRQQHHNSQWDQSMSPNTSEEDDEEMLLMVPSNVRHHRSGMNQRRGCLGNSSNESLDDGGSSQGNYPDNFIQTV